MLKILRIDRSIETIIATNAYFALSKELIN